MERENLQTLTSAVSVQARNLCNELKRFLESNQNATLLVLPNNILLSVTNLAEKTKKLVSWLDRSVNFLINLSICSVQRKCPYLRPPLAAEQEFVDLRNSFLKTAIDIVDSAVKASKPGDIKQAVKNIQMLVRFKEWSITVIKIYC